MPPVLELESAAEGAGSYGLREPLINIALARFGCEASVLKALLADPGRHDKAIRLAALA